MIRGRKHGNSCFLPLFVYPYITALRAGTRSIEGMYLLTLDEIGLESVDAVENIEFTLKIIDDDWDEIDTTDVITLNFG